MRRFLFVCLALAAGFVAPVASSTFAHAASVSITIGTSLNNGRVISCSQGERILRNRGFRDVRRVDCRGRIFVYRAWRSGQRFEIGINSRNARVVEMRRIRR